MTYVLSSLYPGLVPDTLDFLGKFVNLVPPSFWAVLIARGHSHRL